MNAVLIVAGASTRFWPLTEKPLFPICGRSLVEHQVARLRSGGFDALIIVAAEENVSTLQTLFPDAKVVAQTRPACGMREAFLDALPLCGDEPVLLTHGNDVVEPATYRSVRERLERGDCDGVILAKKTKKYFPGGYLTMEKDRVTGIVEKPGEGNEPSDLVSIVVHAFKSPKTLLEALTKEKDGDDAYERAVTKLCATQNIAAVATEVWHAVKYPWHLLGVLELLLEEIDRPVIHPSAKIHPSAVIEGNVIIGPEARVLHHATVIGPSVIGAHAVIGTGALVRGSSIADHCVIGYATEVKSSVLCPHVWTHSTYIGDSVIGENVAFGSGSVIANFRLDEQDIYSTVKNDRISTQRTKMGAVIGANSRLGIRTSLHPGVKVGAGSFVNGGVMLDRDVPDGSFVTNGPEGILVRKNRTSAPKAPARNQYRNTIV